MFRVVESQRVVTGVVITGVNVKIQRVIPLQFFAWQPLQKRVDHPKNCTGFAHLILHDHFGYFFLQIFRFDEACITKEEEDRTGIASHNYKNLPPSNLNIYRNSPQHSPSWRCPCFYCEEQGNDNRKGTRDGEKTS